MFDSKKPTDDDFIGDTPITVTPEEDDQNPNSSRIECNKDAYTDVHGQMIQKEQVDKLLINDDDFMRDEQNQEYDPLANTESIKTMCSHFIFTGPSAMYDREAEIASTMAENGVLMNNITEISKAPWAGALLGEP